MAPTSPIKRVTRARAAKSSTTEVNEPPKKALAAKPAGVRKARAPPKSDETIIATAEKPAKKSTKTAQSTANIAAAPRRRVKVTPLAGPAVEEAESASAETVVPEKQTKTKKTASKAESKTNTAKAEAASKTRTTGAATEEHEGEVRAATKVRGRPKKVAVDATESVAESEKPTRQTRKRSESNLESMKPPAPTTTSESTISKKKVTFQDLPDDDKENQPMPKKRSTGAKKTISTTGLRARPVRKPATVATRQRTAVGKADAQAPRALTPKKVTQVARSRTPVESDEDELNGGKTPIRDLSQSPKRGTVGVRSPSPVKKLDFAQTLSATSPQKASILGSPKRLPQSPFKNSFKESPRRGEGIPVFPTLTATLGVSATGSTNAQAEAALQQSPKRGVTDISIFSQSTTKFQRSTNKPFLSQSPMRRLFSPGKQSIPSATPEVTETAVSSYFRSSQSPIRPAKVHRMSDEEIFMEKTQSIDFDESVLNIRSPVKILNSMPSVSEDLKHAPVMVMEDEEDMVATPATPRGPWSKAEEAEFAPNDEDENEEVEQAQDLGQVDPAMIPSASDENLPLTTGGASYLLNSYNLQAEDESSEDELQADETPQRLVFGGRPSLSTNAVRARLSSGLAKDTGSHLGFTPLATQLSGWLASSPEKQSRKHAQRQGGIFSPLAAQHVPGEVQISRQSIPVKQQPAGTGQSVGLRKSIAARSSLAPSVTDSPVVSSYFADEMAARDLEEQVDSRESVSAEDMQSNEISGEQVQVEEELVQKAFDVVPTSNDAVDDLAQPSDDLDEALFSTGVLEEPVMSDTAMLDFVNIAQEAEELGPSAEDLPQSSASSEYGDENTMIITRQEIAEEAPVQEVVPSPTVLQSEMELEAEAEAVHGRNEQSTDFNTPMRPDLSLPRFVSTVVSKVPLRPEGHISPIKVSKKRSRSLSAGPGSAKKPLLEAGAFSILKSNTVISLSPERQARSPAPSVAASTPGQISFALSDFGDSTLDGIEIPDDSEDDVDDSIMSKIPSTIKSSKIRSTVATPARTPLKAVGTGVLHGAVVFVDVHTTEGADASGIFVDLLTQMGAKCVREWKWNPRASLALDDVENMATAARIGITHVVYKDGGKRTLEKVRDAKGEVCCVGVGWVLE